MNGLFCLSLLVAIAALTGPVRATPPERCVAQTEIRDVVGPATVDLFKRLQEFAAANDCGSLLLLINTPGGSLESTRTIVEAILNSPRPVLCLVSPSGGHAGSAGAIILQACHVNGALRGTNLGAATPVMMGQEMPKDLRQKVMNDTRSWLESLTHLRGRSEKFGREIILDAKAVSAEEAFKLKGIDFVGERLVDFLQFSRGREVKMQGTQTAVVEAGAIVPMSLDMRYKIMSLLTDPELAYMMLLGSLALLYFELTHPGSYLPGVVGGLGLVISLFALNRLEVEWAGLLLILLGVGLLTAELFLPTFGVLGLGGAVALFLGSVFLFDPAKTGGYQLPLTVIMPVVVFFGLAVVGINFLYLRTRKVKRKGGFDDLLGLTGRVIRVEQSTNASTGYIELFGETWKFESADSLKVGDTVLVINYKGLVLNVNRSN